MSFASLGLNEQLVQAINECGYTEPTPIQQQAIPLVLKGGDLLAGAQTGTGKTAGFGLPMLQRLGETKARPLANGRAPVRALVLTPTRELAAQVEENLRAYAKHTGLRTLVMFGGVSINPQMKALGRKVDVVVATPGRLLDHVSQRSIDLSRIEMLVLDEADRMLDMGFIRDIRRILALLPKQRQNLLFSATFSDDIKALAEDLLHKPEHIEVARRNATAETISQRFFDVDKGRKRALLSYHIGHHNWRQVLVFTRTKHGANRLAEQLGKDGLPAMAIHGNKSQGARTKALSEFKNGGIRVLVATDIAARGIDISELPHVVNYELPHVAEDYVHRIGRTGRAGSNGEALSLVSAEEKPLLKAIEKLIKQSAELEQVPGFEPDPNAPVTPLENSRGGNRGRNGGGQRSGGQRSGNRNGGNRNGGGQRSDGQRSGNRSGGNGEGQRTGAPRRRPRRDGQPRPQAEHNS
ncbi:DEAD/DEAH box helicase [Oceanimonas baumannii]|uniref:ATP-dependent RNA helicase RhlE n=1 Tax=Oceanimonas baumannii TaxID=129578 RepID=A0A235CMN1_9GAMM|nr:DEAD/DEAH box helicase [Oceanimonas baumannii]OYD25828.1 RNA helicase [Oceanimonas baumannii]TDW60157.1 ATP-dependent RNA helicase RhlE [Oceanimonas baumannii]